VFDIDGPAPRTPEFGGPTDELVAFLSFGFAARYGAQHDLTALALLLRGERKIDLQPLLTFADRNTEVEADERELERVWQPAAPLAETLDAVIAALEDGDERIEALAAATPALLPRLRELRDMARVAAERDARVRLTFEL
jgi:hypothetical protein